MIISPEGSNANGTLLLDFCKRTGLRFLNGRIGSDKGVGKFTCHTHRGQSVVDYVLASTDILQLFCYFDIGDPNILSDHSIVQFALLSTNFSESNSADDEDTESIYYTVVPRPLSNDPRLFQCIYRYSHASKRFVEV